MKYIVYDSGAETDALSRMARIVAIAAAEIKLVANQIGLVWPS